MVAAEEDLSGEESGFTVLGRPVTWEEIRQIERDRDERLHPANRPANAEVDNTTREWDYDLNDFRDALVDGRPRELHDPSIPVPITERPATRRALGAGLVLILALSVWLTTALFRQSFTEYDHVTLTAAKTGLAVPTRADVKIHGMIVGEVRDTRLVGGQVRMTLGMDPELIDRVPAGVGARIVPKTLFGEKFVDLIPPETPSGGSLKEGDVIANAVVPVEFEQFFNDIYPLLTAVPPERIATTLSALANTLEGRGDSFGETLVLANTYLEKFTPETQAAVDDIIALGQVADAYGNQADEFGELLTNSAKLSRNTVDDEDDLAEFLDETTALAGTLRTFVARTGEDWIATARNSVQPLAIAEEYASMFPCLMRGTDTLTREHTDEAMANGTLHIQLEVIAPQPTAYGEGTNGELERPVIPTEDAIEAEPLVQPENHALIDGYSALGATCDQMEAYAAGNSPYDHDNPFPQPPALWKLMGVRNSHNGKLGSDSDYDRTAVWSNLAGIDSQPQRELLDRMTTRLTGVRSTDVPDVASLLISPVVRGASLKMSD
jgi:virulence factor Mce-like protein